MKEERKMTYEFDIDSITEEKVSKQLFDKLPKYAQAWDWKNLVKNSDGIDAHCKAHKDDPNQEDIFFICDNWEEFLWWVRQYNKNFRSQHRDND